MENQSFSFDVTIQGVPKGVCRKIIEEVFHFHSQNCENEMSESEEDEFTEVYTSLIQPLLDETIDFEEIYRQ